MKMGPIRRNYPWALPLLGFLLGPSLVVANAPWLFDQHVEHASGHWFLGVYSPLAVVGWAHESSATSHSLVAGVVTAYMFALIFDFVFICYDYVYGRRYGRVVDTLLYPIAWWFSVTDYYSYGKVAGPPRDGEGYVPRTPEEIAATDRWVNRFYLFCFRVVASVIGLFFIYTGLFGLNRYFRYPKPIVMTVADFARAHPTRGWYHLEDAKVDYSFPYLERDNHGFALYPVVANHGKKSPVRVFVEEHTSDAPTDVRNGAFECMVTVPLEEPGYLDKDLAVLKVDKPLEFVEPGGPYSLWISLPCLFGGVLSVALFGIWPIASWIKRSLLRLRGASGLTNGLKPKLPKVES